MDFNFDFKKELSEADSKNISSMASSVNSILSQLSNRVSCDKECQHNKKVEALRQKLDAAKYNDINSDRLLQDAEENYLKTFLGQKYDTHVSTENAKLIEEKKNASKSIFKSSLEQFEEVANHIEDRKAVLTTLITQLDAEQKKQEKLSDTIDEIKNSSSTNIRKYYYETQQQEWIDTVREILYYVYFGLLIAYLLLSNFLWKDGYKNIKVWVLIIVYAGLPYFLNRITGLLFWLYHKIQYVFANKLPKDAYYDL